MLYLLTIINLILIFFNGLAFFNVYKDLDLLEKLVMLITLVLLFATNIGIIWVNTQRGSFIGELKRKNNMLEEELANQKKANEEGKKDLNA